MFFILSKTIGVLFQPLMLIVLPGLMAFFVAADRWKKRLLLSSLTLLIFFSNEFIANEAIGMYEAPLVPMSEIRKKYEWGILLTGATNPNKELQDRVYLNHSPERVTHTVMLYHRGVFRKLLISGGSSSIFTKDSAYREAAALRNVFITMGIPDSVIVTEENSRNTYENAVESARVLAGVPPTDCLLITSAFHIPRAQGCFRRVGMVCDVFPTDSKFNKRSFKPDGMLLPSARALEIWEILFKEWVGRLAYAMAGYTA